MLEGGSHGTLKTTVGETPALLCAWPAPCPVVLARPLHKEVMQDRVSFICGKEGVQLDADAFDLLAQVCGTGQGRRREGHAAAQLQPPASAKHAWFVV